MKKIILPFALLLAFASGVFAANITLTENATPQELHLYRDSCTGGYCFGTLVLSADPDDASTAPTKWRERMRWTAAQVSTFVGQGVVTDDTSRPGAFTQSRTVTDAGPL